MICVGCRSGFHEGCLDCGCQHRVPEPAPVPDLPPEILDAVDRAITEDAWVRRERPQRHD